MQVVVEQFVERRLGHRLGLAAGRADPAHQPLGQHREQRVGEVERVHAHVQQPGHCLRRAVGVERGQHQVAGQRGLDRDLSGFLVADLADHDHVRVRAQEGAQRLREGPVDLRIDLHLPQPRLRDFDRILGRPDFALRRVDVGQHRVQRRRLARAGRAHAQHHAVGPLRRRLELAQVVFREAQFLHRDRLGRGQDPHHHVLEPVVGRDRGHAQFDFVALRELGEVDLAVLRLATLGDVEVAHDLDARDHGAAVGVRQFQVGLQHAVLAEADFDLLLARIGLDVDVRHVLVVRVDDHRVDQPDQRVVALLDLAFLLLLARGLARDLLLALALQRLDQLVGAVELEVHRQRRQAAVAVDDRLAAEAFVGGRDRELQRAQPRQRRHDLELGDELDLVDAVAPRRVFHRDDQAAVAQHQRQHLQPLGHRERQLAHRVRLDREVVRVHQRVAHLAGQRRLQLRARDDALAHQQLAQRHRAVLLLLRQRLVELRLRDQVQREQRFADAHHRHLGLLLDREHQLLGRDDVLRHQDVADAAVAQVALLAGGGIDLFLRRHLLAYQQVADALADLEADQHLARHEHAAHPVAGVADRREQEQAQVGLVVADGRALLLLAALVDQLELAARALVQRQRIVGGGRIAWRHLDRVQQLERLELRELQRHRVARRRHHDLRQAFARHHQDHLADGAAAVQAEDLAGLRLALGARPGIGGEGGRRPLEQRCRLSRRRGGRLGLRPLQRHGRVGHQAVSAEFCV